MKLKNNISKSLLVVLGITVVGITMFSSKEIFANNAVASETSKSESTSAAKEKNATVILYLNSSSAIVDSKVVTIDKTNLSIKPFTDSKNKIYVPVTFVAKSFGYSVNWTIKNKTMEITLGDKKYTLKTDSDKLLIGDKEIKMDSVAKFVGKELYISPKYLAENILGKKVEMSKSGLISISESADWFSTDEKINDFENKINMPKLIGTKQNFIDLLKSNENIMYSGEREPFAMGSVDVKNETSVTKTEQSISDSNSASGSASARPYGNDGSFSETNTQVQGVDESDIIKTDGNYIYYVTNQKIVIVDAKNPSALKVVNTIKYENIENNNFNPTEMFLDKNTLTVIGNTFGYMNAVPYETNSRMMPRSYSNKTKVIVYNIEKITDIKEVRTFAIDGYYSSSRKINNIVYLITNNYLNYYNGMKDDELIMPAFADSAKASETIIGFDSIYYFPDFDSLSYMNISSIDVNDTKKDAVVKTYLGSSNNIYSSTENLYVSISDYSFKRNNSSPEIVSTSSTNIYKFGLNNGNITYKSKGSVPGDILNQFSMDEHNGVFRIATTVRNWTTNTLSKNNVYLLGNDLKIIGKLENLAEGEQIYSTRFMGDKIYMVTYRTVDPLFLIDAKDPKNPVVLGQLKIPGYSTYLHPYDETHLIGFGNDTKTEIINGNEFSKNNGMKMSIFDVSDFKNPKEMFTEVIGDAGTYSELLSNHKVLMFSKEKNLLAFPVNIVKNNKQKINGFDYYGSLTFSGAVVYNIDLKTGFKLKTQISHLENMDNNNYQNIINRIIFIKDTLYTFSRQQAKSTDLKTYKDLNSVEFK